ncbi:hypothetical protein U9M48_002245 [Paspalum notatum var. saurae]|uniref:Protein kinase domain-containing protein n=1 Tax=Paspalum notatum var. saurae TaxID=547442 RepID=A0AAQ3PHG5_PASNO
MAYARAFLLLLSVHLCLVTAPHAAAALSFSFNFSKPSDLNDSNLKYLGNATAFGDRISLTKAGTNWSTSRVVYLQPVRLWDAGKRASFTTDFSFAISIPDTNKPYERADGMAFFIGPSSATTTMPPDAKGAFLGLFNNLANPANDGLPPPQTVGVEFDTNYSDGLDPPELAYPAPPDHIGIDTKNISSTYYRELGGLDLNGTMRARVEYDGRSKAMSVSLWLANGHNWSLNGAVDLMAAGVPQDAYIGFSAATGGQSEDHQLLSWSFSSSTDNSWNEEDDIEYVELDQLNLSVLRAATNNFCEENKLGEGGFGEVFKGTLQDKEEIAVKRLLQNSSQGFQELRNELVLAAKLKHRNLVQLLGVSLQEEKLLVYEYMPNRSLDTFLLDPVRRQQLDWNRRFAIINGIARGLLYLHEESRLKVIHRDLKPSNVLLDADMNPKISDFGIARAFHGDQSKDITRRPVGTLGYMAPEYAYWGHVSTKSDMFSFGVIVLEMVTGRRNNSPYDSEIDSVSVLSHVWDKWRSGSTADVVDPLLAELGYQESEVLNCIEIGLLCVQENPADRPDASTVVVMLSSPTTTSDKRRAPARPAFAFSTGFTNAAIDGTRTGAWSSDDAHTGDKQPSTVSENEVSISELQPR